MSQLVDYPGNYRGEIRLSLFQWDSSGLAYELLSNSYARAFPNGALSLHLVLQDSPQGRAYAVLIIFHTG